MPLPDIEFLFEPDEFAEQELGDIPPSQRIDKNLITDVTIRKCRLVVSVVAVEYGTVSSTPAALIILRFVFQPFEARFDSAILACCFDEHAIVTGLAPDFIEGEHSETAITNKLNGSLSIGHSIAKVNFEVARERERSRKYNMRIQGSGVDTDLVRWTMEENREQKRGLPGKFTGAIIVKAEGEINARLSVYATISKDWAIRKIVCAQEHVLHFDGRTRIGSKPEGLKIEDSLFLSAPE